MYDYPPALTEWLWALQVDHQYLMSFSAGGGRRWLSVVQFSYGTTNLWFCYSLSKIDFSLFPLFCQKCTCYICHLTWQKKLPHLNKIGVIYNTMTGEGKLKNKLKQNWAVWVYSSKTSPTPALSPFCKIKSQNLQNQMHGELSHLPGRNIVFQLQMILHHPLR